MYGEKQGNRDRQLDYSPPQWRRTAEGAAVQTPITVKSTSDASDHKKKKSLPQSYRVLTCQFNPARRLD